MRRRFNFFPHYSAFPDSANMENTQNITPGSLSFAKIPGGSERPRQFRSAPLGPAAATSWPTVPDPRAREPHRPKRRCIDRGALPSSHHTPSRPRATAPGRLHPLQAKRYTTAGLGPHPPVPARRGIRSVVIIAMIDQPTAFSVQPSTKSVTTTQIPPANSSPTPASSTSKHTPPATCGFPPDPLNISVAEILAQEIRVPDRSFCIHVTCVCHHQRAGSSRSSALQPL